MFEPIDLSCYANAAMSTLASGPIRPLDSTPLFLEFVQHTHGPVLELGCGQGRYTIPLAERGISITAVDLSAPSLDYARKIAGELPITWVEDDVRSFNLEQHFSRIFARGCIFDFMLSREDQEAMLARVHEHLTDNGKFMFDTCTQAPSMMVNQDEESLWFMMTHPSGREVYFSGQSWFDYTEQVWIQKGYERWDALDGELVRTPWTLTLRYTMPKDLEALLHYNGFEIIAKYAEYDGALATAENPPGIYVCKKH